MSENLSSVNVYNDDYDRILTEGILQAPKLCDEARIADERSDAFRMDSGALSDEERDMIIQAFEE